MAADILSGQDIFQCQKCGQCCVGFGGTYVSEQDIQTISAFIQTGPKEFMDTYCAPSGSKFVLSQQSDGSCIFFDPTSQCTIHAVKPYMCKAWPFIETVIKFPENWNAMAGSCPGIKKNIPHEDLIQIVRNEIIS